MRVQSFAAQLALLCLLSACTDAARPPSTQQDRSATQEAESLNEPVALVRRPFAGEIRLTRLTVVTDHTLDSQGRLSSMRMPLGIQERIALRAADAQPGIVYTAISLAGNFGTTSPNDAALRYVVLPTGETRDVRVEPSSAAAALNYPLVAPASYHRPEGVREGDTLPEPRANDWMVELLRLVPENRNAQVRAIDGAVTAQVLKRTVLGGRGAIDVQYRGSVRYGLTPPGGRETSIEAAVSGSGLIDIETGVVVDATLRLTVSPSREGWIRAYQMTELSTFSRDFRVLP